SCLCAQSRMRRMQAALFVLGRLPPPSARALIFTGLNGARARRAADARVSERVQLVLRQVVDVDVLRELFVAPLEERIELDEPALVELERLERRARHRLRRTQAGRPRARVLQRARQRLDLSNPAA